MRETLKSLSIFSAMLLLLLLISSGCDVNIPGCGKRSLPFFKKVSQPPPAEALQAPPVEAGGLEVQLSETSPKPQVSPAASSPAPQAAKPLTQPTGVAKEMSVSSAPTPKVPTATRTPTATPTPWEVERIAYTTFEKGKPVLWMMDPSGSDRQRLTPVGTGSWFPLWSPNGKFLVFLSDLKDGNLNFFIYEKGGTGVRQLTEYSDLSLPKSGALKPPYSWSPKSEEFAYCYKNQVWKYQVRTGIQQTLADPDPLYLTEAVEWAPYRENKYVAFLTKKGKNFYSLTAVNPRLMDQLTLVEAHEPLKDISWSPDARKVAYLEGDNKVFTASPETSIPKMLLNNACHLMAPFLSYSPLETPETLMVLASKVGDGGYRVALMEKGSTGPADTGTLKYLTEPGVDSAVWSPDGKWIAYTRSGELWVMESSGANKKRIAATGILSPSWSKK